MLTLARRGESAETGVLRSGESGGVGEKGGGTGEMELLVLTDIISSLDIKDLTLHCKENPIYVFLFWELCGLIPNFHIHVYVSDSYISRIGPHISLQQNRQTDSGDI